MGSGVKRRHCRRKKEKGLGLRKSRDTYGAKVTCSFTTLYVSRSKLITKMREKKW
jgi:hypothetical protein